MILVAKRGEGIFLIAGSRDLEDPHNFAHIIDTKLGVKYPAQYAGSATKMGYWEPVDHHETLVEKLLALPWANGMSDEDAARVRRNAELSAVGE